MLTPPVGTTLNVIRGVARIKMDEVIVGVLPFLLGEVIVVAPLVAFPSRVLAPLKWFF